MTRPGSPGPAPTVHAHSDRPAEAAACVARGHSSSTSRWKKSRRSSYVPKGLPCPGRSSRRRSASSACSRRTSSAISPRSRCWCRGRLGRDRDGNGALTVDRRQDERAELGHVRDVAEEPAALGFGEDAAVHLLARGGGDDENAAVEVGALVGTGEPAHRQLPDLRAGLGGRRR